MNIFKKSIANDEELESVKTELADFKLQFESVSEELKTAQEEAAHYQLEFTALNELMDEMKLEMETLKTENANLASNSANVELVASEKAAEIVAEQLGEPPANITEDVEEKSLLENLSTLKGKELMEFYNANKKEIFKSLKH